MPLDPSIPLAARGPRIEYNPINPINAMLQGEQLRGAQQANALRQLQMQQSQREMEQEEVANRLLAGAISPEGEIDYNRVIQGMAGAGQAGKIPALLAQREQAGVRQAQMQAAQATRQRAMLDQALSVLKGANEQNYPTLRSAIISQAPALGQFFPETYDKPSIDALVGRVEQQVKESADLANMKALGFPLTPEGYQQYMSSRFQPTRASQTGATDAASTPAFGKAPSGYRFTSEGSLEPIPGGPAARRAAAPAAPAAAPSVAKPMTPQQEAKRRDQLAKEYRSATTVLGQMEEVLQSANMVKTDPALSRVTGMSALLPSMPGGAAALAETRIANLKGKVTALGKAAAAMSGAIGSIANQEWKILSDQIAVIDPSKGREALMEQIGLIEAKARGAIDKVRDEYEKQFSEDFERFPQFKELPAQQQPKPASPTKQSSQPTTTRSGATVSNW